jgi:hypothetical protein
MLISFVILFSVFVCIAFNVKKHCDRCSEAAIIILTEIRCAENFLKSLKSVPINISFPNKILKLSNSWVKHGHLLCKKMDLDEIKTITIFYENCERIDNALHDISVKNQFNHKPFHFHRIVSDCTVKGCDTKQIVNNYAADTNILFFNDQIKEIDEMIKNVKFISNTTVETKLKKITCF